jgi:serine/threonine-protein kinase
VNEEAEQSEAMLAERPASGTDDSIDSLMRAVAHVSTVDMPQRAMASQPDGPAESRIRAHAVLPQLGDILGGRYQLIELLGAGGMGAVFAAKHRGTGREVAIKVLLPSERGPGWKHERLQRFVREAQAAGRIRHPNVVDVYDVAGDSTPPYLVMERLHGESLWQRMKREPLAQPEAVRIVLAAMQGVAEAHRQGVIHRDLKPDNIFLTGAADGACVPKVLDFGVSRVLARDTDDEQPTELTRTGLILGTPSYMPIEQLRGNPDVDVRADVYALGVILYEVLSGRRPYEASNDHDLVVRMVTEAPLPLAQAALHIDSSLSDIVMKALARDAADRYPSVSAFAERLSRWQAGERESAPAPASAAATGRTAPRRPGTIAALLLVLLGAVVWAWGERVPAGVTPAMSIERAAAAELNAVPAAPQPVREPAPPSAPPSTRAVHGERALAKEPQADRPAARSLPRRRISRAPAAPAPSDRATKLKPEEF